MSICYPIESYAINGAIFEVHKQLGCGFLEKVYQEALSKEFTLRGIPYEREKHFKIQYKEFELETEYIADFYCYNKIIVELKAVEELSGVHRAQVVNYLKATDSKLGILANFGSEFIEPERFLNL